MDFYNSSYQQGLLIFWETLLHKSNVHQNFYGNKFLTSENLSTRLVLQFYVRHFNATTDT